MKLNRYITYVSIIMLILAITIPVAINVNRKHNEKVLHVTMEKIKGTALRCYYRNECPNRITLQELYDLDLLEEMANPFTKEIYNPASYVLINNGNTEFVEVRGN